jgi:hypothetical protein
MASTTTELKISGTIMWAKVFERNRDQGEFHTETDGACTVNMILEKEELDKLKAAGSRLRPNITDDGLSVKFRRAFKNPVAEDFGGAPQVVDGEGNDWDDSISIGNLSKGTVAITIYETKMGKGTRLEGLQVTELVEFATDGGSYEKKLPF